jgi:hypothetical protein
MCLLLPLVARGLAAHAMRMDNGKPAHTHKHMEMQTGGLTYRAPQQLRRRYLQANTSSCRCGSTLSSL